MPGTPEFGCLRRLHASATEPTALRPNRPGTIHLPPEAAYPKRTPACRRQAYHRRMLRPSAFSQRSLSRLIRGFTAIELMVTVAILAILAALAAPSFTPLMERWRVRQIAEELQSTLYYARSEAIKRGGNITIARHTSGSDCSDISTSPALWNCGWTVFFTAPGTTTATALQEAPAPSRSRIEIRDSQDNALGSDSPISIDRWGQITLSSNASFDFLISPENSSSTHTAKLCIYAGGRVKRLDTGSNSCS